MRGYVEHIKGRPYAFRVLIVADMLANAILGGVPGDTISYRAAKARREGRRWGCVLCRFLDVFERDHCGQTAFHYENLP